MAGREAAAGFADAIVVAAGASSRMAGRDKLAEEIGGRPVLAWSVAALAAATSVERVVIVTAADRAAELRSATWLPEKATDVVAGGARRQESVAAGFARLEAGIADRAGTRVVLVHDGARPCVTSDLVDAVAAAAREHGAAIPVLPVAETLKQLDGDWLAGTVDREALATAQTPQGVRRELLRQAYAAVPPDGPDTFTDEAALLEACRIPVRAIPGSPTNLKVTLPADLGRAETVLAGPNRLRVGAGHDQHAFGPGTPLALGGIEIAGAPRLHGHSDGDVALHAVADALLGAAGLGDLGRFFPADERTPQGIASWTLVERVVEALAQAGWRPSSIDLTIVGARPRLGRRLDEMAERVATLTRLDRSAVSVKASTGNLGGPEGAGRAMSAQAVAVVAPRSVGEGDR